MCLSDLLQWIGLGRKTGKLLLERDSLNKLFFFKDGRILSSSSNNPRESFGHFLVSERQITEEQLFRALVLQHKRKKPLGEILVEEEILDEPAIRRVLEIKTSETVFDTFSWSEGRFYFYEEEAPHYLRIMLSMEVSPIILEGIKRIDDWTRIRELIPCNATTFAQRADPADLGETYRAVYEIASRGRTVAQIATELNVSDHEASVLLCEMLRQEFLIVDTTGEEQKPEETVRAIRHLIKQGDAEYKEGRLEQSLRIFHEVLRLDPLNQYAKIYILKIRNRATRPADLGPPRDRVLLLRTDVEAEEVVFTPQEIQVIGRINGERTVGQILAEVPLPEEETLAIVRRLLSFSIATLRD